MISVSIVYCLPFFTMSPARDHNGNKCLHLFVSLLYLMYFVCISYVYLYNVNPSIRTLFINNLQFLLYVARFLPRFLCVLLCNHPSPSFSPPLFGHLLSFFCQFFMCDSFHMTIPCQPNPHQFLLTTFRNSKLHSQFILLLSSLLTPTILLTRLFSQTCTFSCCFIVSAVVFIASMYAGVINEVLVYVICVCIRTPFRYASKPLL